MSPSIGTDGSQESGTPFARHALVNPPRRDSKVRTRHHRTVRASTMLIMAGVVLCLFIIWNRDRSTVSMCLGYLNPIVKHLQEKTDALGVVPLHIPSLETSETFRFVFAYTFDADDRQYALETHGPIIIAYTPILPLFLHANGRCVIIHEKGESGVRIRSAWLSQREFDRQWAEQLRRMEEFRSRLRSRPVELPK